MDKPVRVRNAPGLIWRSRTEGKWEARWQCRTDKREAGYPVKSVKLGTFLTDPTKEEWDVIADNCNHLQQEMLLWGTVPTEIAFDGSLSSLMICYRTDPDSKFKKLRYNSRCYYETLMGLIDRDYGTMQLAEIKSRTFLRWHETWSEGGKAAVAHGKIGMLRTLFGFGLTMLEDTECGRLKTILSEMRFEMPKPRTESLSAEQATAIRAMAHQKGRPSIALAQAFQFELMLRQKDCIGEWVPMPEPGMSDTFDKKGHKWLRGIRWEEIDQNMVLSHVTSKRQKRITVSLQNAPMVMEEMAKLGDRPATGPIIVSEHDGLPWDAVEFRRWWRICADACGVPKTIRNMDSRAGGITEASDAGADLEHIRHAATHSNISMTQRYSRGAEGKIATVQKLRVESRNKSETK